MSETQVSSKSASIVWRALIPCTIAIVITTGPLAFQWARSSSTFTYHERRLHDLQSVGDVRPTVEKLERVIQFWEAFYPSNRFNPSLPDPVNRLRTDIAQLLQGRSDIETQNIAIHQHQKVIERNPVYNYGWPYYLIGRIYENRQDYESAIPYYQRVAEVNHTQLDIRSQYRNALLRAQYTDEPIEPEALYLYLRFVSDNLENDLQPFTASAWKHSPFESFIYGAFALIQEKPDMARRYFKVYSGCFLNDPFVQYLASRKGQNVIPQDGDLMASYYYRHSIQSGDLLMQNQDSILFDCFVPNIEKEQTHSSFLECEIEPVSKMPVKLSLSANRDVIHSSIVSGIRQNVLIDWTPNSIHTVFELHVQCESNTPAIPSNRPLLRIMSLRIKPQNPDETRYE